MNKTFNTSMSDQLNNLSRQQTPVASTLPPKEPVQKPTGTMITPNLPPMAHQPPFHRNDRNDARSITTTVDEETWRMAEQLRHHHGIIISAIVRKAVIDAIRSRWERETRLAASA